MKPGDVVAERFRILRLLGEGGMASVWAAHHELIGRDVALKITHERLARRPEIRDRFLNEAKSVGRLRHPNIIDVVDFGELADKRLFIVFELLDGEPLSELLERHGRLSQRDAVAIAIEICKGLEMAHAQGVVHRDLKPANVFLHAGASEKAVVKLLDFGISKLYDADGVSLAMTQTGMVLGTPQYMSVEQARGFDDIDARTDVWGVGVILYELVSGFIPFAGSNYNAMLDKIIHADPPPLRTADEQVSAELESVVRQCLAKSRTQRFNSARELRQALEGLSGLPHGVSALEVEETPSHLVAPRPDAVTRRPPKARRSMVSWVDDQRASSTLAPPTPPAIAPGETPTSHRPDSEPDGALLPSELLVSRRPIWPAWAGFAAAALGLLIWWTTRPSSSEARPATTSATISSTIQPVAGADTALGAVAAPGLPPEGIPSDAGLAQRPDERLEPKAEQSGGAVRADRSALPERPAPPSAGPRHDTHAKQPATPAPRKKSLTRVDSAGF